MGEAPWDADGEGMTGVRLRIGDPVIEVVEEGGERES